MRRRDLSLTIALCTSLIVHAAISRALADRFVATHQHISLAGNARDTAQADVIATPVAPPPALEFDLGSPDGHGSAIEATPGDVPMQARQADEDQPLGRIDPPGAEAPAPAQHNVPEIVMATPAPPAKPFGIESDLIGPAPKLPTRDRQIAVAPAPAQPLAPAQVARGEPAPQLPSEADPFSKEGSVKFQHGKTDVQFGRKHKLIRPRFDLAVQLDLLAMSLPITLVLKLRLDEQGNVAAADVEQSSGSKLLDHAVKITAYKWWFEPKKLKDSSPDEFLFTIEFL
jgi:TonB family protein